MPKNNQTYNQRMVNLYKANKTRSDAANVKAMLRDGEMTLLDCIFDHRVAHLPIHKLIESQKMWGKYTAATSLNRCQISPLCRVDKLTLPMIERIVHQCQKRPV